MSSKRARFDASAQLPATESQSEKKVSSPMAVATQQIRDHLASLRPEFATILEKFASVALKAKAEAYSKQRNISRMETDDTVIPRSARVKFDLTTKNKPVETSVEYITLKDETAKLVADFQSNLKAKIVASAKLDIKFLEQASRVELAKALRLATTAFLIADGHSHSATDTDRMVNTILDRHHEELLKTCQPVTLEEFRTIYKETHGLADLPQPRAVVITAAAAAAARPANFDREDSLALNFDLMGDGHPIAANVIAARTNTAPIQLDKTDKEVMKIFRTFHSIFVVPWKSYQDTMDRNDIGLELKKLSTSHFVEQATDDAAMEIDNEASADPTLLRELISKLVLEKTSVLQQKIDRLEKNKPRGQARGASNKKENPTAANKKSSNKAAGKKQSPKNNNKDNKGNKKNNNTNNKKKSGNQRADDPDNASNDDKKKSGKNHSKNSKRSKASNSNNRTRSSSNQSRGKRT